MFWAMQLSLPVKSFPLMLTMVFILVTLWGLSYRYSGTVQGEVAERSKAAVLKTVEPRGSRGSNPWPTAILREPSKDGFFYA